MASINFFSEDISCKLPNPRKTSSWIKSIIKIEGATPKEINYIFCSDEYLRTINLEYLNHNTYTDIITFNYTEGNDDLTADIFISIERIKENALKFNSDFETELHRVIIHGVLHLVGYNDKTKTQKAIMREKEDAYLSLRK
jgi:probable rRNA maturation factor